MKAAAAGGKQWSQEIEEEATKRAQEKLWALLPAGTDLKTVIPALRAETERKLKGVDSELATLLATSDSRAQMVVENVKAVSKAQPSLHQGMGELKRAVVEGNFWHGDSGIAAARGLLTDAVNAKRNIRETLDLCDRWLAVPLRVRKLITALKEEPFMIETVAVELQDLKKWRRSLTMLLKRIEAQHDGSSRGDDPGGQGEDLLALHIGRGEFLSIKSGFESHMSAVAALENALDSTVMDNVRRCIDLGISNPGLLVLTFVLIEQRSKETEDSSEDHQRHAQNLQMVAQAAVHEAIVTRAQNLFQRLGHTEGMSVDAALSAASQVLQDLRTIAADVNPCMPKDYECVTLAKNLYQSFLLVELERYYCSPRSIPDTLTILRIVNWLDFYNTQLEEILGAPAEGEVHCVEFEKGANDCIAEFMIRMQLQLNDWISGLEILSLDILKDSETKLITSFPTDMMRLLRFQLDTAMSLLAPQRLVLVLQPVVVPLLQSQIQFTDYLDRSGHSLDKLEVSIAQQPHPAVQQQDLSMLSPERLAATANDLVRMSGLIATYRDELECKLTKSKIRAPTTREAGISIREALEKFDDVSREYLELAFKTTGLLSRTIMIDVGPTIINGVGGFEWEGVRGEIILQTVTTTLDDYFQDVVKWSDAYLFPRLLRACLEEVFAAYVKQLANQPRDSAVEGSVATDRRSGSSLKLPSASPSMIAVSASNKWRKAMGAVRKNVSSLKAAAAPVDVREREEQQQQQQQQGHGETPNSDSDKMPKAPRFPSNREKLGELLSLSQVTTPFRSASNTAVRIERDCMIISSLFDSKYEDEMAASGLREGAAAFLRPLHCVASIVRAKSAFDAKDDVEAFLKALRIMGLRTMPTGISAFNRVAARLVTSIWARKGGDESSRREFYSMAMRLLLGGRTEH